MTTRLSQLRSGGGEGVELEDEVLVFGEVSLTESELSVLKLGPGFMVVSSLDKETMRIESAVTTTNIRWSKMKDGTDDMTAKESEEHELENEETEEQKTLAEMIELEARDVLDDSGTILDMRRKRVTDMKCNRRVMMPAPGKPILEAEYSLRVSMWQREYEKYMTEECDDKGMQKQMNLTKDQAIGLKTLKKGRKA